MSKGTNMIPKIVLPIVLSIAIAISAYFASMILVACRDFRNIDEQRAAEHQARLDRIAAVESDADFTRIQVISVN